MPDSQGGGGAVVGTLKIQVLEARDLHKPKLANAPDCYVQLAFSDGTVQRTLACKEAGQNPFWYEAFYWEVSERTERTFQGDVYYESWNGQSLAGRCVIDFDRMIKEGRNDSDKWFVLWRKNMKPGGSLHMILHFEKAKTKDAVSSPVVPRKLKVLEQPSLAAMALPAPPEPPKALAGGRQSRSTPMLHDEVADPLSAAALLRRPDPFARPPALAPDASPALPAPPMRAPFERPSPTGQQSPLPDPSLPAVPARPAFEAGNRKAVLPAIGAGTRSSGDDYDFGPPKRDARSQPAGHWDNVADRVRN